MVFGYTLVDGDGDHNSVLVMANSLTLDGGTIRSQEKQADALLDHNGAGTQGGGGPLNAAPTASFQDVPEHHDGETAFTVGLRFSGEPAGLDAKRDAASVLEVTGGTVTGVRRTETGASPVWEVTVAPSGIGDVTVRLPARACGEAHAACIGGRALAEALEAAVPGLAMTAGFTQAPDAHDGSGAFELHLAFSHEPKGFSYRTVRDALFDIEGGRIERVWRNPRGQNRQWGIEVVPAGDGAVTLTARATTSCAAQHAACDDAGRKFAGDLVLTIEGLDAGGEQTEDPPDPITARWSQAPAEHDGTNAFKIRFHLSASPGSLSYVTVRDSLFAVTGGSIDLAP